MEINIIGKFRLQEMSQNLYFLFGCFLIFHITSSERINGTFSIDYKGTDDENWKFFKKTFNRTYNSTREEEKSKKIFLTKLKKAEKHNKLNYEGKYLHPVCVTQYSDMLFRDLQKRWKKLRPPTRKEIEKSIAPKQHLKLMRAVQYVPNFKDWRLEGAITSVKNQRHCGSCWAFAATGALEAEIFIRYGTLVSLSVQELLDCGEEFRTCGCVEGFTYRAFDYIIQNGITSEYAYPYLGADRYECARNPTETRAVMKDYVFLPAEDEITFMYRVFFGGPIACIMCVTYSFKCFVGDVFDNTDCFYPGSPDTCNGIWHSMLIVGFGTTPEGKDYWLVKNSWGVEWGDHGYIKVARNKNLCKIANYGLYPVV